MTRIFLKLYGGILTAFLVLFLISYLVLFVVNQNRYLQYQQSITQGVLALMGDHLDSASPEKRINWMSELNRRFDLGAKIYAQRELDLGRRQLARLAGGLPASAEQGVEGQDKRLLFYRLKDSDLFLGLESAPTLRDLPSLTRHLVIGRFDNIAPEAYQKELQKISKLFTYELRVKRVAEVALNQSQLAQLSSGGVIVDMRLGLDQPVFISQLPGSDRYLSVGPIEGFNGYPFSLVAAILCLDLALLGLVAYILVRPIEKRLAGLARAAKQIKKGQLDVRAEVDSADAIGFLAAAFNAMAEHIQMLLDMQNEMIRAVSHELRTPVARLRFSLQMIEDAESDEERLPLLGGMDDDMQELDELIDEILTYAKLEHSTPELLFTRVDIDGVMERVIGEMSAAAKKNNILLEHIPESLPQQHRLVEGEERYLHRVIQNFVGNAIRYAESQVRVSFLIDGVSCKIVVEDDGPGIPEEEWDKVFAPFARLDTSRNRASGGYGLGLSIVQRIVNWHHGKASVEQSTLGGAMFVMEWPIRQPDELSVQPDSQSATLSH
jgi:two-component system sensor histidine kinase RstB